MALASFPGSLLYEWKSEKKLGKAWADANARHEFMHMFGVVVFSILETFSYMHSNHESRT